MYAIITGASSGIGKELARCLLSRLDLILVARNEDKLKELTKEYNRLSLRHRYHHKVTYYVCDVSDTSECEKLYEKYKDYDVQILINNAGSGVFGEFADNDYKKELNSLTTNVIGPYVLTKLFLGEMLAKNRGYIMNVASSAGYMPGSPDMAVYYASKAFVLNMTRAIVKEESVKDSNVYISALCPGPVATGFNENAGIHTQAKGMKARKLAKYAIKKMYDGYEIILPGFVVKATYAARKVIPDELLLTIAGKWQEKKK
ncbi:MAG: SDR family NAD(P)-dependent oxidoreductase [Lachnospiraceae bacterium]|nr:SDR family NAD(P)-dependent oxidoreductase [Lachnospiraceae bacterium]